MKKRPFLRAAQRFQIYRKAFDLKGRLAALGCEPAEVEDLL